MKIGLKVGVKHRGPLNFSMTDWQRLLDACPIKRKGEVLDGEFLACFHVSKTQLSVARVAGGCTIGTRKFIYLPQHDMLVRSDFNTWAVRNWRKVLGAEGSGKAKCEVM